MKPATRHKMKIAGVEVETFPSTHKGEYVRKVRCWHQSYWRLVMVGEVRRIDDALRSRGRWVPTKMYGNVLPQYAVGLYRRRVGRGRKP